MGDVARVEVTPVITGPDAPVKGERPPSSPQGTRPDYVPEKFWKDGRVDLEGLAKSYVELEKTKGKPPATDLNAPAKKAEGAQEPKTEPPKEGETKPPTTEQVVIPGVTQEQTVRYWDELSKGSLSEASYGELAKAGYPKVMVDAYIRGIQAEQADGVAYAAEVKKIAGGEDGYATMTDWMATNVSPEEVNEYNKVMTSGNKLAIKASVEAMYQRYTKAVGTDPNLLLGRGNTPAAGDTFKSFAEVTAAMKDIRYRKDPAYRQEVADKIKRSNI